MKSEEIRKRFLAFFKKRNHVIIPSASLIPENDPSVLFITAGMQPLVPYFLGEKHPEGTRLANIQKCVRTQDIEEVGDRTHDTFFEMLGNWSLGDYFKKETISWSYEFLTSKKEGLGLDPKRLYITCFEGDDDAPRDIESSEIWESVGIPKNRIYFFGKESNWWSPGENGPCGPDTEMFYDITHDGLGDLSRKEFIKADDEQQIIELWNDVFMEYEKKDGKIIGKLEQKNVDTGAGLERLTMVMQKKDNIFDTDLFIDLVTKINTLKTTADKLLEPQQSRRADRIVADHIRTSVFLIGDGVIPSNTDRGYILRRLLRRAIRYATLFGMPDNSLVSLVPIVVEKYKEGYPNLYEKQEKIKREVAEEEMVFRVTLQRGMRRFKEKISAGSISGTDAFILFSSHGFPLELTLELIKENRIAINEKEFEKEFKQEIEKHQGISRMSVEKKFKGGLAGNSDKEIQYHTATHLLHQALLTILGNHVLQRGSNITSLRLRFDFSHPQKMTDEEKKQVEDLVNKKIKEFLPVSYEEMTVDEARKKGAIGLFDDKYGKIVKVYQIGDDSNGIFSLELCGGPHVSNTSELGGIFKIKKEEAVALGIRRIKAILE